MHERALPAATPVPNLQRRETSRAIRQQIQKYRPKAELTGPRSAHLRQNK